MVITVKPNFKMLPFGICALIIVVTIFDYGLEAEQVTNNDVIQVVEIAERNYAAMHTKDIHFVKEGENLSIIFEQYRVPLNATYQIFRQDKSDEIKNIKPGDRLEFIFLDKELTEISISKDPLKTFKISLGSPITIKLIQKKPEQIMSFKSGVIDSSFYLTGLEENMPESVIMDLAYIFGWDIDFIFDIRTGDRFKLLYETPFVEGAKVENGSILFAEFYNKDKKYTAIRHRGENKKWEYFNESGGSLEKAFLRAPLDFAYVSSHFNPNRRHPILNKIRAHNGVDYAAKRGTPIRSTGEGVIESIGWKGGYGRTIIMRHGGDITTLYAHMDKYDPLLAEGSKVKQGQTIGYVGDSGLATAPHLHYEFRVGKKRTDPVKVALPSASPLKAALINDFESLKSKYKDLSDQLLSKDPNAKFFK